MLSNVLRRGELIPVLSQVPSKRYLKRLSISGTNRGRCPGARETIQRFSLAGIHGGGRDLRAVWEEVASLAPELGALQVAGEAQTLPSISAMCGTSMSLGGGRL